MHEIAIEASLSGVIFSCVRYELLLGMVYHLERFFQVFKSHKLVTSGRWNSGAPCASKMFLLNADYFC